MFIPEYHASIGAIGAALIEADLEAARDAAVLGLDVDRLPAAEFPLAEPLSMDRVLLLRDMAKPFVLDGDDELIDAYMGIDIGSVSTNLVVIDERGRGHQGDLHEDRRAARRGREQGADRHPR